MSAHPFTVKAVFDYASDHEDDLVFSIGQIITVTEEEDADWYYGEYTDEAGTKREGLFPKNFVEKYEPPRPAARPMRHRKDQESVSVSAAPTPAAAPAPAPAPASAPAPVPAQAPAPVPEPPASPSFLPGSPREEQPPFSPISSKAASQPQTAASPPPQAAFAPVPAPAPASPPVQQTKPRAPSSEASSEHSSAPSTARPVSAKPPPPGKPSNSAFKDRIAAFNKSAAAPVAPLGMGPGPSQSANTFVKKSFVAPPPSKNAYVPPVQPQAPPPLIYKREETPESQRSLRFQQQQSQQGYDDSDSDRGATSPAPAAQQHEEQSEEEEQQPRTTLKERIALLQKQQLEQAARRSSEAAHKKEKPKKPVKKQVVVEAPQPQEEGAAQPQAHHAQLDEGAADRDRKESVQDHPETEGYHAQTGDELGGHEEGAAAPAIAGDDAEHGREEAPDEHQQRKQSAISTGHDGQSEHGKEAEQHNEEEKTERDGEEAEEEQGEESEESEEEEIDPEIARRMAIRDRMAKMSGAMGMMGMFGGPPGGMPGMLPMNPLAPPMPAPAPKKKKEHPPAEQSAEHEEERVASPVSHAPPVPMPGLFAPKKEESTAAAAAATAKPQPQPQAQQYEDSESDYEQTGELSEESDVPPPPPPPHRQPSIREPPFSPKETRRDAPPPPPLDTRPPPPPVPRDPPAPMSPREPPPMPPKATPVISTDSMSGDEMSASKAVDSASEAPESRHRKFVSSPEPTSPIEDKPRTRAPPPVPQMPPASPTIAQRPVSEMPNRRLSTFTPTIRTVVSDDESGAYDGDYDTDLASTHHRAGVLDGSHDAGTEESSTPTTPYENRPPPIPSIPPPRAAPPPPVPSAAPPPPRHSPAPPPPPPGQPPKRVSAEMSRPPPPPPAAYDVVEEEEEDQEEIDRDYNSRRYSRPPVPVTAYDSSSTSAPFGSPTYERTEEEAYVAYPGARQSYHPPPPPPPHSAAPPPPPIHTSPVNVAPPPMIPPMIPPDAPAPSVPTHAHHQSAYTVSSPSSSHPPASSSGIPTRTRQSIDVTRNPRRSMDVSRPEGRGYMAIDVDMGETSSWWTQDKTPPPVFKGRQDILWEVEQSTSEDNRTITKDVYVLYPDYSQTVITVEYSAQNPSDASFSQRHEPPPQQPRQDQLASAHDQFGKKLSSAASSKLNTTVGDGTPHAFVRAVLEPIKKDALMPVGVRAYGAQVYGNMANASVQQADVIQPGDIVTFRSASFRGHKGTMHQRYSTEVGKPDHVAVVVDWDGTKKKIRAMEQGRESRKVKIESFKLSDMRSGECRVWRVMPRSWVGWDAAQ